jgi:hypothetical protein
VNPNQPQYPPPGGQPVPSPASAGKGLSFSLTDIIVAGAAFLFLIFSFTPFESIDLGSVFGGSSLSHHENLWSVTTLGWWIALADILLLASAAVAMFWPKDKEYVGFRRSQVQVGLALFVLLDTAGLYISLSGARGWGGAICIVFALVAAAGAVLGHLGLLQNSIGLPTGGPKPAVNTYGTPTGYPQQGAPGGYPQQGAPGGYPQQGPPAGYQPPPAPGGYPQQGNYPPPQGQVYGQQPQNPPPDTIV